METLVANLSGTVRKEILHGRDFVVAPMTLIVPGVLNGSKGPILYQLEDIQQHHNAWDGIPIHINHPDSSGRLPQVLNGSGVGWVFNTEIKDKKLIAEGWFDVERLTSLQPTILNALLNRQKVELSTGLAIDIEASAGVENGTGTPFTGIARRYRPDHLAILPDTVGACSVKDGCGVNNLDSESNKDSTMDKLSAEDRTKMVDNIVKNCSCWKGDEDRKTLEAMSDKALNAVNEGVINAKKVADQDKILNAAREGFKAGNVTVSLGKDGKWVHNVDKEDKDTENDEAEKEEEGEVKNQKAAQPKPITLKDLPIEVQNQIAYGARRMEEDKTKLIDRLATNAKHLDESQQETYRKFLINEANGPNGIQKLETMAMALPAEEVSNEQQSSMPIYLSPVLNRGQQANKPEPLGLPTWEFAQAKS